MTREEAIRYRKIFLKESENLTDEEALKVPMLYPRWETETEYTAGERIFYEKVLFKCVQSHTSQSSWTPDITPALWTVVSLEEWPEWVQPIGAQDAYMAGDKVSHAEKHWISSVDNNVWEPGVYGWDEA